MSDLSISAAKEQAWQKKSPKEREWLEQREAAPPYLGIELLSAEDRAWLDVRIAEGKLIDPETAVVTYTYGSDADPYGFNHLPEDELRLYCCGRQHFARRPDSDVWVSFDQLDWFQVERIYDRLDPRTPEQKAHAEAICREACARDDARRGYTDEDIAKRYSYDPETGVIEIRH